MKPWLFLCAWAFCAPAFAAEPVRLVLAIGSNVGAPDEAPLRYADLDARRFRDLMVIAVGPAGSKSWSSGNQLGTNVTAPALGFSGKGRLQMSANGVTVDDVYGSYASGDFSQSRPLNFRP